MKVVYSPETGTGSEGLPILRQATALLDDLLSRSSSDLVTATWVHVENPHGYRLTIEDFTGKVSTDFSPEELVNSLHMRFRIPRLWGDLLQIRNDEQHRKVQSLMNEMAAN